MLQCMRVFQKIMPRTAMGNGKGLTVTVWKKYSLGIVLVVLFLAAWAVMTWSDWMYFVSQQAEHHQPADVFGASG